MHLTRFVPRFFSTSFLPTLAWVVIGTQILIQSAVSQTALSETSLSRWRATGVPPTFDAAGGGILPAGTELSQSFAANEVEVHLVTRPYFGSSPESWPTLEIGPTTLSFVTDAAQGAMVLLGDTRLQLPAQVALGSDGRSMESLDFTLRHNQVAGTSSLQMAGKEYSVAAASGKPVIDVALNAGSTAEWRISSASVTVIPAVTKKSDTLASTPRPADPKPGATSSSARKKAEAEKQAKAFAEALTLAQAKDFAGAEAKLEMASRHEPGFSRKTETAARLLYLAFTLQQFYDYRAALVVGRRALVLLAEGKNLSSNASRERQAEVHEIAGFIYEEILHDQTAAHAEFEKARAISPGSKRAQAGLERLAEEQARTIRLAPSRGGNSQ